jgi:hypothetical protein
MVMAVQRIEGAEDWGLVGNWELWRRGGQRTARPPPSSDDTDVQQRGRDHARHLLRITDYTYSCKTRGVSRALLRKCVACRSHHHVRLSALPAIIARQRWNCSRSYMRLLPTCISRWRLWDFRHSWSEPVASSHHSDGSLRAGTVQRWPRDLAIVYSASQFGRDSLDRAALVDMASPRRLSCISLNLAANASHLAKRGSHRPHPFLGN